MYDRAEEVTYLLRHPHILLCKRRVRELGKADKQQALEGVEDHDEVRVRRLGSYVARPRLARERDALHVRQERAHLATHALDERHCQLRRRLLHVRGRHRYEVEPKYVDELESKGGLRFTGKDERGERMQMLELDGGSESDRSFSNTHDLCER